MPVGPAIGVILGIAAIVDTLPRGHQIVVVDIPAERGLMQHRMAVAVVPAADMLAVVVPVETTVDIVSR